MERNLVKCGPETCSKCKYSISFSPGGHVTKTLACDYASKMKHSRIFVKGKKTYDSAYCDKFEEDERKKVTWSDTNQLLIDKEG